LDLHILSQRNNIVCAVKVLGKIVLIANGIALRISVFSAIINIVNGYLPRIPALFRLLDNKNSFSIFLFR
jgi:hypothetical protein